MVVGGRASNNTRQLVETCRAAGKRAARRARATELVADDLAGAQVVGSPQPALRPCRKPCRKCTTRHSPGRKNGSNENEADRNAPPRQRAEETLCPARRTPADVARFFAASSFSSVADSTAQPSGSWRAPLQALFHRDQIPASDFPHLRRQRFAQRHAGATARLRSLLPANFARHPAWAPRSPPSSARSARISLLFVLATTPPLVFSATLLGHATASRCSRMSGSHRLRRHDREPPPSCDCSSARKRPPQDRAHGRR